MGKKTMTWGEIKKIAEDHGLEIAPPDHPAYSEGVTISFISRKPQTPKRILNDMWPLYTPHDDSDYGDGLEECEIDTEENIPTRNIIPFKYDSVSDFNEGLAIVTQNGRNAAIDKSGNEVFSLPYDDFSRHFSEGMLAVRHNGNWGFVDKTGKLVIEPVYDAANDFQDGVAYVKLNGSQIYINKEGKETFLPEKLNLSKEDFMGCELVEIECDGKYGFADKTGREVVAPIYDYVDNFCDGLAEVYREDESGCAGCGVINEEGKEIVPTKYESIEILNNGLTAVTGEYELLGLYNEEGEVLFEPYYNNYEYIGYFNEGFAIVHARNGTFTEGMPGQTFANVDYAFINERGKEIAWAYECASEFNEGRAAVKRDGLWGFIDKEGNEIVELVYDQVRDFHEGRAAVCMDGKWGYIDLDGKVQSWSIQNQDEDI